MRRLLLVPVLTLSLSAGLGAAQSAAPAFVIAGFSFQRALAESTQGKAAIAKVNALRDQKAKEVDERNNQLVARQQALQKGRTTLPNTTPDAQAQELDKFRLDTERFIQDAQAEFLGVQREAETAFLSVLEPVLLKMVKDRGVHVLVNLDDKTLVLWSNPSMDLTADVVAVLNQVK